MSSLAQRGFSVGWILICRRETRQYHCGKACPSPAQPYEGLQIPISTPEKISPTLLEMPPNSWPNEAFSLTSDARAFLIRGTQYPLSPWPGSEISQVMGGTVDTLSSYLPPTWRIRLREGGKGREMLIGNAVAGGKTSRVWRRSDSVSIQWADSNILGDKAADESWNLLQLSCRKWYLAFKGGWQWLH